MATVYFLCAFSGQPLITASLGGSVSSLALKQLRAKMVRFFSLKIPEHASQIIILKEYICWLAGVCEKNL